MITRTWLQTAQRKRLLPRLATDHLWVIIVLVAAGMLIAITPTPPNDFWWHLKAGELVATAGIPTTNLFAWTLPADAPYVYATWLGEWLFYLLYQLGGFGAVVLARNLLALAGFSLVALEARRRSSSWRLAALAVLLAAGMSLNNVIIRTQNWSWVPVALYALVLGAYAAGQVRARVLLLLPLVMLFWVNAHGAFVVGLGLIGVYTLGEALRRMLGHAGARSWREVGMLGGILLATLAATLANPLGWGIFGYVRDLLTDAPSQGLINEWQPPTTHNVAGVIFYGSVLALLAALAYARRRPTVTDVLLIAVFMWQAWSGVRYVVWFGMVVMPILAQSLAAATARPQRSRRPALINSVLALLLTGLLLITQPPFLSSLPMAAEYRAQFAAVPGAPLAFDAATPVAATDWLRAHAPPGMRLFNEMGYGSYLAWALYPQAQSFIDPRVELFPLAQWDDYVAITNARDYNALLDTYGVTHLMIDTQLQDDLAKALAHDAAWTRLYHDERTEIYARARRLQGTEELRN